MTTILSVSVPKDLRAPLDAEAKRQKRSRSFVVTEAIREYVERQTQHAFAAAKEQTLRKGLELTPQARVKLSDDLWQEFARGRKPTRPWVATFATFDEYEKWRRKAAVS